MKLISPSPPFSHICQNQPNASHVLNIILILARFQHNCHLWRFKKLKTEQCFLFYLWMIFVMDENSFP